MNQVAKTLLATTALTVLIACTRAERFEEIDIATLPHLDYCELRKAPTQYDGKIVRINARIANFGHGDYFDDGRCGKKVYENLLDDDKTAVTYFAPRVEELDEALKRLGFVCCDATPLSVIAVGRFTRKYPTSASDIMTDRTSFHFELFSIEPAQTRTETTVRPDKELVHARTSY